METTEAAYQARALMAEHGLEGWRFCFDESVRRFGCCSHGKKMITLSRKLVAQNPWHEVKQTVLHEIAHALVGPGHGHDAVWKAKARSIGASDSRCYDAVGNGRSVEKVPYRYVVKCCGRTFGRYRLPRKGYKYFCPSCKSQLSWQ